MKDSTDLIDRAALIYAEFKHPTWRSYTPRSSRATDQKRLWAIALSSDWAGNGKQRMERLLALLPRAVEQAARLELYFTARTTVWTTLRSAEGLERLAGGIVPGESGRGWESGNYDEQVLRMRLDEDVIAFVRAIATMQNISASEVVAGIIEAFVESYHPESNS